MGGNTIGGLKAKAKYLSLDPDYYKKIGKKGGSAIKTKPCGFAAWKANGEVDRIRQAGATGGAKSRRTKREV